MDLTLKLAPTVIAFATAGLAQIYDSNSNLPTWRIDDMKLKLYICATAGLAQLYDSNSNLPEWRIYDMKLKLYRVSIFALGICGLMQLERGDYTNIVNVTAMTAVLEFMNGYDTGGIMRWPIPIISAVLTYINW